MKHTTMTTTTMKRFPDAAWCSASFGCTVEQAKRLLGKNADRLGEMAERAERSGKTYNGYTASELRASESDYRKAARE